MVSIEYLPPEMTPRTPSREDTIVDVRCELTVERDAAAAELDAAVEKLRVTVRQMKADGMGVEMIARFTGLTAAEIDGM